MEIEDIQKAKQELLDALPVKYHKEVMGWWSNWVHLLCIEQQNEMQKYNAEDVRDAVLLAQRRVSQKNNLLRKAAHFIEESGMTVTVYGDGQDVEWGPSLAHSTTSVIDKMYMLVMGLRPHNAPAKYMRKGRNPSDYPNDDEDF